jgi:hypothetical protein
MTNNTTTYGDLSADVNDYLLLSKAQEERNKENLKQKNKGATKEEVDWLNNLRHLAETSCPLKCEAGVPVEWLIDPRENCPRLDLYLLKIYQSIYPDIVPSTSAHLYYSHPEVLAGYRERVALKRQNEDRLEELQKLRKQKEEMTRNLDARIATLVQQTLKYEQQHREDNQK